MTTKNPAQDVSDAAIAADFRLTDSINRDADKFVDDVNDLAKRIDADKVLLTNRPSVESLWQAFWATPHDEREWNRPTGTDGKPMPLTLVSFKCEVVRAAFELDAARELQQAKVPGCEDCAYNGRMLCDTHGELGYGLRNRQAETIAKLLWSFGPVPFTL